VSRSRASRALSREEKLALLARRLAIAPGAGDQRGLTSAQARLWFLYELEPGSTSYNICRSLELSGELHVPVLEQALSEIVRRHEPLRTTFESVDHQPVQRIGPPWRVSLPVVDLSLLPPVERSERRRRAIREEARQPFDLVHGPPLRLRLLRLGPCEHVLTLCVHHIAADGWSLGVLFEELAVLYESSLKGEAPGLPTLSVPYADYGAWQREWLAGGALAPLLRYWREQLAGAPPLLDLAPGKVRPELGRNGGARCARTMPLALADALEALAQRENATPFMAFLAGFSALLQRFTGQRDVVVGTPIANRTRAAVEPLIGCFANTLALRTRVPPGISFRELLRQVRMTCLDAYAHQSLPFERLVEELHLDRSLRHTPVFQVMLLIGDSRFEPRALPGLKVRLVAEDTGAAAYDVTLCMERRPEGLVADAQYDTGIFSEREARRLLGCLERVLEAAARDPDRPIEEAPLLEPEERRQVLEEWARAPAVVSEECCVHQLVAAQAARTPDAVAVSGAGAALTYAELEARASQLAHHLRSRGAGPERAVAILLPRSAEQMVAVLAVLQAGAGYLPLDPSMPPARLRCLLDDGAAVLVVTNEALAGMLPAGSPPAVLVDREAGAIARHPRCAPGGAVDPAGLAYVIYTSGSTGRPKGVVVPHRSLAARAVALAAAYRLGPADRVLQLTSLAFDVAAEELFPAWLSGATVVLAPQPDPPLPQDLGHFVAQDGLTVLNLPAPYWHQWVDALPDPLPGALAPLRLVVVGSDRVAPERLARWRRLAGPRVEWLNAYGLTETTITSTLFAPPESWPADAEGSVPVGRPLAGTTAYVLDERLQPLSPGIPGELFIGGEGLARGYVGRPDLTAAAFIPDPFSRKRDARMYRTGDRALWRADGVLQLLGRNDHQLKVRGYRVEPSEIEAHLLELPGIAEAVVVPHGGADDVRLVAYAAVVGSAPTTAQMRAFLAPRLPEPMLPSLLVTTDALPRTVGGKVDRGALPPPDWSAISAADSSEPAAPLERALGELWADVLRLERVGLNASFFDLGGHSLLATQLVARMRELFRMELPLRVVFEAPSVAQMAEALRVDPAVRDRVETVARLMAEVAALSDAEIERMSGGAR
jgi:amino acid adenylation domain-containing protein